MPGVYAYGGQPCEEGARRWPSVCQERPWEEPALLVPGSSTSRLQACEKINWCSSRHPACTVLYGSSGRLTGIATDGVAWSYGNCAWHFKELPRCFLECLSFLTVQFLYIIVNTCHCLSILAILMGTKWYLAGVLFYTSLMTHDVEHFPHIYLCFKNEIPE